MKQKRLSVTSIYRLGLLFEVLHHGTKRMNVFEFVLFLDRSSEIGYKKMSESVKKQILTPQETKQ